MPDNNFKSHYGNGNVIDSQTVCPLNPLQYNDILKFSECTNTVINNCSVTGGSEDCIDLCRGRGFTLSHSTLSPNGKNGVTIKGAFEDFHIYDVVIDNHGTECDIEIGQFDNYWYPGRKPTSNGLIERVRAEDGKPVVVKLWDADNIKTLDSNVRVIKVNPVIVFVYFMFRYCTIKLFGKP